MTPSVDFKIVAQDAMSAYDGDPERFHNPSQLSIALVRYAYLAGLRRGAEIVNKVSSDYEEEAAKLSSRQDQDYMLGKAVWSKAMAAAIAQEALSVQRGEGE